MLRALALLLCLGAATARAHDVMGSVIFVDLGRSRVHLELELPLDELSLALDRPVQPGIVEAPATAAQIVSYVLAHLSLTTPAGEAFQLVAKPGAVIVHDYRNWQKIELDASPPHGDPRDFVLHANLINHRVLSHHIFVFLRHDLATAQLGEPQYLATLHYQLQDAHIKREAGTLGVAFAAVLRLGMEHIAEGSDHLLFLLTMLLPAGLSARRRWGPRAPWRELAWAIVRIVTAFTLGHSLTLLLGTLGLLRLPSVWVESLIAVSVLASALHAMVPIFPRREAHVALGFGLVHGLGFASALEGLGVDGPTLAITLLGFNLGVELMQVAVVSLTLPWLFSMQGTRLGGVIRVFAASFSLVVAGAWLGQRALGLHTRLPEAADWVFAHGGYALATLALASLLARALDWAPRALVRS